MNRQDFNSAVWPRIGSLTALCALASVSAYAASQSLRSAHAELLSDESFSFDYTIPPVVVPKERKQREPSSFGDWFGDFFAALGPIMVWMFYLCVGAIVLTVLFFIIKEAVHISRVKRPKTAKAKAPPPPPAYQPDEREARTLLSDVDALAAQGRYDEAVHTLLLRSIEDMKANKPRSVPRDLTSREISGLQILSDSAREAFAGIGSRVERSLFGGRPLSREDFDFSRAAYEGFAFETNPKRRRR